MSFEKVRKFIKERWVTVGLSALLLLAGSGCLDGNARKTPVTSIDLTPTLPDPKAPGLPVEIVGRQPASDAVPVPCYDKDGRWEVCFRDPNGTDQDQ